MNAKLKPSATTRGWDGVVWKGVFRSFAAANPRGPGFLGDEWLEHMRQQVAAERQAGSVRNGTFLARQLQQEKLRGQLRIVDFGGGWGRGFSQLTRGWTAKRLSGLCYHIVDNQKLARLGRQSLATPVSGGLLRFHSDLTDLEGLTQTTVVHAESALHYAEDWRAVLAQLAALQAPHLVLAEVPASDNIDTFVTCQNLYGSRVPVWFWHLPELVDTLEALGYQMVARHRRQSLVLGRRGPLPMNNFPESRRLSHTLDLAFRRVA